MPKSVPERKPRTERAMTRSGTATKVRGSTFCGGFGTHPSCFILHTC
jgi:hypothetical protein